MRMLSRRQALALGAGTAVLTLILIPALYVMLEERFPRRVAAPDAEMALEGDRA